MIRWRANYFRRRGGGAQTPELHHVAYACSTCLLRGDAVRPAGARESSEAGDLEPELIWRFFDVAKPVVC